MLSTASAIPHTPIVQISKICHLVPELSHSHNFKKTSDLEVKVTDYLNKYTYGINLKLLCRPILDSLHSQTWVSMKPALLAN